MYLVNNIYYNKKIFYIILIMIFTQVNSLPYPKPKPENIIKCFGYSNETICGTQGKCEYKVINNEGVDKKIKLCVCNDQYGTLSFDNKPCTRKRITQATAFWLQIFFGWIQVGAFMLHWWWYALSVFITCGIFCCCTCFCLCHDSEDDSDNKSKTLDTCNSCLAILATIVILTMWIINAVYIGKDCYSVIEITSGSHMGEHSLACWNNL
jgi:hypothetical protein